jgi:hypothetical protein
MNKNSLIFKFFDLKVLVVLVEIALVMLAVLYIWYPVYADTEGIVKLFGIIIRYDNSISSSFGVLKRFVEVVPTEIVFLSFLYSVYQNEVKNLFDKEQSILDRINTNWGI